ncbi:Exocyst subunit Exo70 family protein [Hirschfeldia incana]|nr:Exocyst subunit Exo70 family protein [Hirschfeldia incana]
MVLFALTSSSSSKLKQHSHRSFSESLLEDTIEDAESIIHQWISPDSSSSCCTFSLFSNKNREEAKRFIRAVSTLHSAMVKLISVNPTSSKLIKAESLLKTSMNHLSKEFYRILKSNRRYLDPESVSVRSRNVSQENDKEAMADLKMIADCMTSSGHGKECFGIYKKIRRSIIVEALEQLGFENLTLSQVQRLEWEVMEKKIRVWLRAARKAVTTLFYGERILSDHVFSSSSAAIRESSFAEITLQSALALFSFPGHVAKSRKTPEKIFLTLDVYQCIAELTPMIDEVFGYDSTSSVKSVIAGALGNLEEAVVSMIDEFESSISKESSKSVISGGGIHQLTRYVMNYIVFLADYSDVLANIVPETSSFGSPEEEEESTSSSSSPLAKRISWLILFLLCKIDAKSRLYDDVALSYLFLINNLHYVVVKVRSSNLKEVLSEGWLVKHEGKVKKYVAKFEEIVWGGMMTSLATLEEEEGAEEFVRGFSDRFEEAYKRQTGWVVPDSKLRDEIKVSVAMMLIPAYTEVYKKYRVGLLEDVGFAPEDIGNYISDLYFGSGGSGCVSSVHSSVSYV